MLKNGAATGVVAGRGDCVRVSPVLQRVEECGVWAVECVDREVPCHICLPPASIPVELVSKLNMRCAICFKGWRSVFLLGLSAVDS